jgi:hypothetical protein
MLQSKTSEVSQVGQLEDVYFTCDKTDAQPGATYVSVTRVGTRRRAHT